MVGDVGFEFGQIKVQSSNSTCSVALWLSASYLVALSYSCQICEVRGITLLLRNGGKNT